MKFLWVIISRVLVVIATFFLIIGCLFFHPEDVSNRLLSNVGSNLIGFTVSVCAA